MTRLPPNPSRRRLARLHGPRPTGAPPSATRWPGASRSWQMGAGRKAGGRNKRTLLAMELREQFLQSSYSPLTVLQKNIRWAQDEAEKLQKALEPLDVTGMD